MGVGLLLGVFVGRGALAVGKALSRLVEDNVVGGVDRRRIIGGCFFAVHCDTAVGHADRNRALRQGFFRRGALCSAATQQPRAQAPCQNKRRDSFHARYPPFG